VKLISGQSLNNCVAKFGKEKAKVIFGKILTNNKKLKIIDTVRTILMTSPKRTKLNGWKNLNWYMKSKGIPWIFIRAFQGKGTRALLS
jgi:hypothetical protein